MKMIIKKRLQSNQASFKKETIAVIPYKTLYLLSCYKLICFYIIEL